MEGKMPLKTAGYPFYLNTDAKKALQLSMFLLPLLLCHTPLPAQTEIHDHLPAPVRGESYPWFIDQTTAYETRRAQSRGATEKFVEKRRASAALWPPCFHPVLSSFIAGMARPEGGEGFPSNYRALVYRC